MKIYVASSWRNEHQQSVVNFLRECGHEVYDFKKPSDGKSGFHWSEIDPNWKSWTTQQYREALRHEYAQFGFNRDFDAMEAADACVLVLPCGRSAHLEAGWMKGAGKTAFAYIPDGEAVEPELMYKMLDGVTSDINEIAQLLSKTPENDNSATATVTTVKQEPLADIVAEMRGTDNKCQLATKDGTGCYHCPFGSAASNCLFDKFADRIEAAHKREVDKLNSVIQTQRSTFDAEQDRHRREATAKESLGVGNVAKLREALGKLRAELWNNTVIAGKKKFALYEIADAALAAPARQCDVGTADEQGIRLRKFCVSQKWCDRCPLRKPSFTTHADCKILWAQLPYEESGVRQ